MRPLNKLNSPPNYEGKYGVMRQRLLDRIGSWCSYCEAPLTNDAAVEHKVPKTADKGFPERATEWVNLLLACQTCNSAKGPAPLKTEQTFEVVMNSWIWPDCRPDPTGGGTLTDETLNVLTYEMTLRSQEALEKEGVARVPSGTSRNGYWRTASQVKVWVVANEQHIGNNTPLLERVKATIKGLNLNYYNEFDAKCSDRRVDNRTRAWEVATDCAADLAAVWESIRGEPQARLEHRDLRLVVRSIRSTALSVGYWSVWWTVLRSALQTDRWTRVDSAIRSELLEAILVRYWEGERDWDGEQTDMAPPLIFAGTDTARINCDFP